MRRRALSAWQIICIILGIGLGIALVYMLYTGQQQKEAESAALQAAIDEAAPYEKELRELKSELDKMEDAVSYASEDAEIMVGFVVTDASDLTYIEEKTQSYDFPPIIILDCTLDTEVIEEILETADDSWEIMLYAPEFSEEINDSILEVMAYLDSVGKEHTGVFFLRNDYRTTSNIETLKEDGFIGYTDYHSDSPIAGQAEDGMVYFDYSYLSSSGTSITSRLSYLYANKAAIIIAFDMESIQSESMSDTYVEELLGVLEDYADYDDCDFSTVADVVEELSDINSTEAANQADYEQRAEDLQQQIEELEEIIDAIYDRLEY